MLVPVRARELIGIVVAVEDKPREDLKEVLLAPDAYPFIPSKLLELARWISSYYCAPLGLTLRAMLPGALWGASRVMVQLCDSSVALRGVSHAIVETLRRAGGHASASHLTRKLGRPVWGTLQRLAGAGVVELDTLPPDLGPAAGVERFLVLSRPLPSILERERVFGRAARQRSAYETVDALGGEAAVAHLTGQLGFSRAVLNGLVGKGVAELQDRERLRDPFADLSAEPAGPPSREQQEAIDSVRAMQPGRAAALFGVTGSGKTLVYLEALRGAVLEGKGAIVLVPEIGLTPQTIARVRGVFGDSVAVLHSGLSDAERADAWRALASGRRRVAVGARSAVFAPVDNLAAIIVDEEHDASYKSSVAPRYHARDVALRRAVLESAQVILGSATPSLETWAARHRILVLKLSERASARPLPEVRLLDLRCEALVRGSGPVPWSEFLDQALADRLRVGDQTILLLNRRGFAQFLQCPACGEVAACPSCSITLTVHRTPAVLRCHYCDHVEAIPRACQQCGHEQQRARGVGTQALERWLVERFPSARLARMDADTTTTKWSHRRILESFALGDIDVLLGTQMISKGLDFPNVTLVGVVDADTALHLPDFRAAERTFQLIAQVAGRAGRGAKGGSVIVQTRRPDHYALQAAASHDFELFAEREIEQRRSPPYPPNTAIVNVLLSGSDESAVTASAVEFADWMRGLTVAQSLNELDVVGPAPAPLARIKRQWRWHLLLRSKNRRLLGRVVRYASRRAPQTARRAVKLIFDRDPVSLL